MILELRGIFKTYLQGKMEVPVLKNVSLSVEEGEYVAIMGPSGSGKTTLMNIIGCLDNPTSGEYLLEGEDLAQQNDAKLSEVRLHSIGFVFQSFYLLPRQSAVENVALPLLYAGVRRKERLEIAKKALERVGLGDRTEFKPTQLSGGQCQRVAIARAIVNNPKLLLADEPTGALDTKSGEQIMEVFQKLNDEGVTIVMITHEPEIAAHAGRVLHIRDGRLTDSEGNFLSPEEPVPQEEPLPEDMIPPQDFLQKPLDAKPAVPTETPLPAEKAPEPEALPPVEIELPEPEPETEFERKAEPEPEIEPEMEAESEVKPEPEMEAGPEVDLEREIETALEAELESEIAPEPEPEAEPEIEPEEAPAEAQPEPDPQPELQPEPSQEEETYLDAEIAALLDAGLDPAYPQPPEEEDASQTPESEPEPELQAAETEPESEAPELVARSVSEDAPEQLAFNIWADQADEDTGDIPFDTAFDAIDPYEPQEAEPQEEEPQEGRFGAPLKLDLDLSQLFAKEKEEPEARGGFGRPIKTDLDGVAPRGWDASVHEEDRQ